MNSFAHAQATGLALFLALLNGCGGNVNLGGKGIADDATASTEGGAPSAAEAASESVVVVPGDYSLYGLAVAGDFLYFTASNGAQSGVYRCRKARCGATRELLISGNISALQVFGQRLGVATFGDGDFWLGSYSLPNALDQQVTIRDLPAPSFASTLFYEKFLFFALSLDDGLYRCALPDCAAGPERIARTRNDTYSRLQADADQIFWSDGSFIYRAGDYGRETAHAFLPDVALSDASADILNADASPPDLIAAIAVGGGMLYASVSHSDAGKPCDSFCPYRLMRWPSGGGAGEILFSSEQILRNVMIFGSELVWFGPSMRNPGKLDASSITTCRVEACEATRRDLGEIRTDLPTLVVDDLDVYWIKSEPTVSGGFVNGMPNPGFAIHEIRRAPRLPPP